MTSGVFEAGGLLRASSAGGLEEFLRRNTGIENAEANPVSQTATVPSMSAPLTILFGVALAVLVAMVAANRRSAWVWRAIARGSSVLALVGIVVGVAVLFFFDSAFLLFHLVFFPQGNFSFDPRTQRLTQLFPDQFWTETSRAIVIVGLAIAVAVSILARRRAARLPG